MVQGQNDPISMLTVYSTYQVRDVSSPLPPNLNLVSQPVDTQFVLNLWIFPRRQRNFFRWDVIF